MFTRRFNFFWAFVPCKSEAQKGISPLIQNINLFRNAWKKYKRFSVGPPAKQLYLVKQVEHSDEHKGHHI